MEATRRASLADDEARQMRAVELALGASRSRNVEILGGTANSVVDTEDTTEGVQITKVVGSEDQLADRRRFTPQVSFNYHSCISIFVCIGDNCMSFCWGWGKWNVSARVKFE
ncbi:hypothetical protein EJD97_012123 [Solanum chilense]|uniref:Uncharacterized protein n=1 Tax=Solanum chilense TaxID=4083 RepID=A0A6N2BDU8_SOLCI|nr:hypothetical protein EJD97_012123 [Solanum chilense]